jgi:predicted nucleotidyltransferase/uncharacterized protein with HEPN domain
MKDVQDRATRTNMARLAVMLEGIAELQEYVRGGLEAFTHDETLPYGASHKLGQISYSSGRISRQIRRANPQVPWRYLRRIESRLSSRSWHKGPQLAWQEANRVVSLRSAITAVRADRPSKWPGFDGRASRVYRTRSAPPKGDLGRCVRCGYVWRPRKPVVRSCARCKSRSFDVPEIRLPHYGGGLGIEEVIGKKRSEVLRLARRYGATEVRIFGSVARRDASGECDVDMIVDPIPGRELRQFKLSEALEGLLGRRVSVLTEEGMYWPIQTQGIAEAVPL